MDTSKAAATLGRKGGLAGRGASQVRGDSAHYRAIRAKRRLHIPAPGRAVGLRGEALCGRTSTYLTGDHEHIRRAARGNAAGYCARCLAAL
jgi:hypothetical protein